MRSWANNPRFMRAQQKIAALRPEHRAILQTVTADANFADEAMRKQIRSMITKTGNASRERNFGLKKRITRGRNAMDRRNLSYNKGQDKKALGLGIANLGLSAAGAHTKRQRDKKVSDILESMANNYKTAGINADINAMDNAGTLGIDRFKNYNGIIPDYLNEEQ